MSAMLKKLIILIFFTGIGVVYFHNLTRDIYSGDVGDLVTAAIIGGVPHPTGYPLFSLLGFLLSKLPILLPPVTKVGLISVFASLGGLIFIYKYSLNVTKSIFLSVLTTSILAFSYLFWFHAEIPEVFALNNFFIISVLYFGIRFQEKGRLQDLYILTFLTFLSLTHHHTILLIFPTIAFFVLRRSPLLWKNKFTLPKLFLVALLGLLPYIYVPIAASTNQVINWDNAVNIPNFIRLILRQDYGGFAPSVLNGIPFVVKAIVVNNFLKTIVTLYSYQIIFVILCGLGWMFKKDKWLFVGLLFAFIFAGPFFMWYSAKVNSTINAWSIHERFYMMPTVILIFFVPYGFDFLKKLIEARLNQKMYVYILLSYFLIVPFFQIQANYPRTNLSKTQIGNNLARDFLSYLPKNSILFVSGDTTIFNLWYVRYGLKYRSDVEIINPGGVGGNKFLDQEINNFNAKNPNTKLDEIVHKTIEELRKKRRVFATYKPNINIKGARWVPLGLVYELMDNSAVMDENEYLQKVEENQKKLHIVRSETLKLAEQNLMTPEIPLIYSNGLLRIGDYLIDNYQNPKKAEHYYRRSQWIDPENPGAHAGLGLALYKGYKDCKESVNQLKEAISLYHIWKRYYHQLYILYDECGFPDKTKGQLIDLYKDRFNDDLIKRVKEQI